MRQTEREHVVIGCGMGPVFLTSHKVKQSKINVILPSGYFWQSIYRLYYWQGWLQCAILLDCLSLSQSFSQSTMEKEQSLFRV